MKDPAGTLIMELHLGENDDSPMQFISAELLAYYRALDAELHALRLMVVRLSTAVAAPAAPSETARPAP